MKFERLALIGCGLMGGSFALALKRAALVNQVVGFSPSASTTARALALGVIDAIASSPEQAVQGADLVLLALPVAATEPTLQRIRGSVAPGALLMDVGSTKSDVAAAAARALGDKLPLFVPAHPICGAELSGVDNASADLYAGRQVVLTPLAQTDDAGLQTALQVWTALGCHVHCMTPEAHDAAYAAVSHLPHLIAFALMNSLSGQSQGAAFLSLAGPGFRDSTRIAASEPSMWRDILLANREQVLAQSRQFQASLQALEQLITSGDGEALKQLIESASQTRSAWRISTHTPS
jgi:prephenate dehydrogenase